MRVLLHNPGGLSVLRGAQAADFQVETVSTAALRSVAGRLGTNDHLPVLLSDEGALPLVRELRAGGFKGPILVLAAARGAQETADLLYAGADDVVVTPADPQELTARIDAVARRLRGITGDTIFVGDLEFYLDGRHPRLLGQEIRLSAREYDILRHLMLNSHRVVAKDAIYDALYSLCAMPPFDKIIEVYICKLRSKMRKADPDGAAYIETVTGRGYRIAAPQSPAILSVA